MKKEFKVSMNNEEKLAGNAFNVELDVDMSKASREDLEKYAFKAYIVELQGQIRPNWADFLKECVEKKFTKALTFGDALFAKKAGTVTLDKATETLGKLDKRAQYDALLKGGILTQEQYELLVGQLEE